MTALDLARHWVGVDQPERALDELARAHGEDAVSLEAARLRSLALYLADREEEATAAARTGLAGHGPDPVLLLVLGEALTELGRVADAERALLDGLAMQPEDVPLLCAYARLCASVGQVDKAAGLVARAATYEPDTALVARTRVIVAAVRGDDAEAQRLSRELLALDPEDAAARSLHGVVAGYRADVGEAYRSFRFVAAQRPGDRDVVKAARALKAETHPLLVPMRPLYRFGPFKVWIVAVAIIMGLRAAGFEGAALVAALSWAAYCLYSWTVPPAVRYLIRRGR